MVCQHTAMGHLMVKDTPPTPTTNPYQATAKSTMTIHVTNQFGEPIPNVQIFSLFSRDYVNMYFYTDAGGVFADTMYAGRNLVKVYHPETDEEIYNQEFFMEPYQHYDVNVQINMTANGDDTNPHPILRGLKAYPVPFNASRAGFISFSYNGNSRLVKDSNIRLYDTKGRFITEIPVSTKGVTNWTPPADMASGMYIARLISGNRFLDTTSFSIIK
jgi:hypothetical protein